MCVRRCSGVSRRHLITALSYPPILAQTSLNDTRVLFTEAAKWVARLQDLSTSDNLILLKTEMSAGHGGVSGRYKQWEEVAFEIAWILQQTGAVTRSEWERTSYNRDGSGDSRQLLT
jgi:oligopeptidase B